MTTYSDENGLLKAVEEETTERVTFHNKGDLEREKAEVEEKLIKINVLLAECDKLSIT